MSGTVFLGETEISAAETQGQVFVPIVRTGDLSTPASVDYSITGNEAVAGQDFVARTGTVTFAAGQDRILVPVTILDDQAGEATETFTVSLTNVEGAVLQAPRTTRVAILDNETPVTDPATPPLVSPYSVTERVVASGLSQPIDLEMVSGLPNTPAGAMLGYVAEKGGAIKLVDLTTGSTLSTFVNIAPKVNNIQDRGLLDIALDPNFPSQPHIYAFYVVDPPQAQGLSGNAGPDGGGNRFAHVVRFTADVATGYRTAVPGSETIILGGAGRTLADISGGGSVDSTSNLSQAESGRLPGGGYVDDYIKVDSRSHAGGALAFGPDGALYVSIGDGTSFNFADPRSASVQNLDSLSGKILRIDPATGLGLADNPFVEAGVSLSSNRARVYQSGLRNPFSMTFDQAGQLVISDTGWNSYEEINVGGPGANFGWPYYEGGDGGVLRQTPGYNTQAGAAQFYAAVAAGTIEVTGAYRGFSHLNNDPGYQLQAITGGDVVYDGNRYPVALQNDYFFADVSQGEVFTVDLNDRREVTYLYTTPNRFAPVHFTQGDDGYVYYVDLVRNHVGRLEITGGAAANQAPEAVNDSGTTSPLLPTSVNVLANDSDPDGPASALRVSAVNGVPARVGVGVDGSAGGRFVIGADGAASFTPDGDFGDLAPGTTRTTSVSYAVADANGAEDTATYSVTVAAGTATGSLIEVLARGQTGAEIMQLSIGGNVAAVFENVAVGGATYAFRASGPVSPGDVRVAFLNDRYEPAAAIDYNLIVDKIRIDGVSYETEAANVYSTGSWLAEDGIVAGFGRGDTLATNGYFQYADTPVEDGSTLAIFARGERGEETMQLVIDGQTVATYLDLGAGGQVIVYNSPTQLAIEDIRLTFTNDLWQPQLGIDRNLIVDKVVLDGVTYETEAASVFSTGMWRPEDGITSGFGRGDTLATNGYIQYAAAGAGPAT